MATTVTNLNTTLTKVADGGVSGASFSFSATNTCGFTTFIYSGTAPATIPAQPCTIVSNTGRPNCLTLAANEALYAAISGVSSGAQFMVTT